MAKRTEEVEIIVTAKENTAAIARAEARLKKLRETAVASEKMGAIPLSGQGGALPISYPRQARAAQEQAVRDEQAGIIRAMRASATRAAIKEEARARLFGGPEKEIRDRSTSEGPPSSDQMKAYVADQEKGGGVYGTFGRSSPLGMFGQAIRGAGPLLGLAGVIVAIEGIADGMEKVNADSHDVSKNWADATQDFAKSIPLLASLEGAGESINEYFTEQNAAISEMNSGIKLGNELMSERMKLAAEVRNTLFAQQQQVDKYQGEANVFGLTGTAAQRESLKYKQKTERESLSNRQQNDKDRYDALGTEIAPLQQQVADERNRAGKLAKLSSGALSRLSRELQSDSWVKRKVLGANGIDVEGIQAAQNYQEHNALLQSLTTDRMKLAGIVDPKQQVQIRADQAAEQKAEAAAQERDIAERRREVAVQGEIRIADAQADVREKAMKNVGDNLKADLDSIQARYTHTISELEEQATRARHDDPGNTKAIDAQLAKDKQAAAAAQEADKAQRLRQDKLEQDQERYEHSHRLFQIQASNEVRALRLRGHTSDADNLELGAEHLSRKAEIEQNRKREVDAHRERADEINRQARENQTAENQRYGLDLIEREAERRQQSHADYGSEPSSETRLLTGDAGEIGTAARRNDNRDLIEKQTSLLEQLVKALVGKGVLQLISSGKP